MVIAQAGTCILQTIHDSFSQLSDTKLSLFCRNIEEEVFLDNFQVYFSVDALIMAFSLHVHVML